MSIKLHSKHGLAPVMEICKLSGYSTGRIILLGKSCHKHLDEHGNLPRFIVTGEIHPKIHETLKQGGVCVVGPERFDCVLMNASGAKGLFKKAIHGHFVRLEKEAWDYFLTLLPKQPHYTDGSHVGEDFPAFDKKDPSAEDSGSTAQERTEDAPAIEEEQEDK